MLGLTTHRLQANKLMPGLLWLLQQALSSSIERETRPLISFLISMKMITETSKFGEGQIHYKKFSKRRIMLVLENLAEVFYHLIICQKTNGFSWPLQTSVFFSTSASICTSFSKACSSHITFCWNSFNRPDLKWDAKL